MYIHRATDVEMTKWLPEVCGRWQRTAVGRRAAGDMTLTCEPRLFKSGRTTLRLVLQAIEKVYDALRLETMRRSVREMRRTGV